jgi:hypothetical protein
MDRTVTSTDHKWPTGKESLGDQKRRKMALPLWPYYSFELSGWSIR